jgi:two-component system, LytTR family, response regulator
MINAVIIDDEIHCRKTLAILLKEYCPEVRLMDQCTDAETGIEAIQKLKTGPCFSRYRNARNEWL